MYDLATGQSSQIAQHDGPIKCVRWVESPQGGILATGSWDKTIRVGAFELKLTGVELICLIAVLGLTPTSPDLNRDSSREMLLNGCCLSTHGCRNRWETCPNLQPHQSYYTLSCALDLKLSALYKLLFSSLLRHNNRRSSGRHES